MLRFEKDTPAVSQSKSLHISKAYTTEFRTGNEDDEPAGFTRSKIIYVMGMILGLTPNKKRARSPIPLYVVSNCKIQQVLRSLIFMFNSEGIKKLVVFSI